jgi:hypothetical protein
MGRHCILAALLLVAPVVSRAQSVPEDLLSASNQVYFRWDGIGKHRSSYANTAVGRIIQAEMGPFRASLEAELHRLLGASQVSEKLLQGSSPDRLKKLSADADEIFKLLSQLGQEGFVVALELRRLAPLDVQVTLIIPQAGSPFLPVIRAMGRVVGTEFKEVKLDQTTVLHSTVSSAHVCAWHDQGHAILTIGSDTPRVALVRARSKGARLTGHHLFQRLSTVRQVETSARGFVDLAGVIRVTRLAGKEVSALLSSLGLDGMKHLTFYSAFRGEATRSVVELEADWPRPGRHGFVAGRPFRLADIPAIPPDVSSWSSTSLELVQSYDFLLRILELACQLYFPDQIADVQNIPKQIDEALGMNLRTDLLAAVGDHLVVYHSPSEGPFFLGLTILLKVKDGSRVRQQLDTAVKNLARFIGGDVRLQKRIFRGQELREVVVRLQGFFPVPTYTVYKGWLVLSLFPQPVQGFILRTSGELPAWQAEPRVKEILDKIPAQVSSLSVSDPRPGLSQLLAHGPLLLGLLKSFSPASTLDVDTFPNASSVTRHLFPNVSVAVHEGNVYRSESISSLGAPFDWAIVEDLPRLFPFLPFLFAF